jgi:hypothetical protein
MQDKDAQILRISGELVVRLWVPTHMRQSVVNFGGQAADVLRIPSGVQEMHTAEKVSRPPAFEGRLTASGAEAIKLFELDQDQRGRLLIRERA